MTPAVVAARRAGVTCQVREYRHDPDVQSFGREATEALGVDSSTVFKTLVVGLAPGELAVASIYLTMWLTFR